MKETGTVLDQPGKQNEGRMHCCVLFCCFFYSFFFPDGKKLKLNCMLSML